MKKNFPIFVKEIDMQDLEAQHVPNKMDAKKTVPTHIKIN